MSVTPYLPEFKNLRASTLAFGPDPGRSFSARSHHHPGIPGPKPSGFPAEGHSRDACIPIGQYSRTRLTIQLDGAGRPNSTRKVCFSWFRRSGIKSPIKDNAFGKPCGSAAGRQYGTGSCNGKQCGYFYVIIFPFVDLVKVFRCSANYSWTGGGYRQG